MSSIKEITRRMLDEEMRGRDGYVIDERVEAISTYLQGWTGYTPYLCFQTVADTIQYYLSVGKGERHISDIHDTIDHMRFNAIWAVYELTNRAMDYGTSPYGAWLQNPEAIHNSLLNLYDGLSISTAEDWMEFWETMDSFLWEGFEEQRKTLYIPDNFFSPLDKLGAFYDEHDPDQA